MRAGLQLTRAEKKRAAKLILLCLCIIAGTVFLMNLEAPPGATHSEKHAPSYKPVIPVAPAPSAPGANPSESKPGNGVESPRAASPDHDSPAPTVPALPGTNTVGDADLAALSAKNLLIPVAGVAASQLRDTFYEGRSEGRQHQALDIMAPKDTPVLATADGKVARLFQSDKGGITLYELDSSGLYYYYYAHLSHYADGITEGKPLNRGDVIAYVGDTGNAGHGNYHLHFAISKPSAPGKWSGGEAIDPYPLLAGKQNSPAISGR